MSSEVKITATTDNEDFRGDKEPRGEVYHAACCLGVAHMGLPEEFRRHFEHFGVRFWRHEKDRVTITVTLVTWFPYKKNPGKDTQSEEEFKRPYEIKPSINFFRNGHEPSEVIFCGKSFSSFLKNI